jgi:integrase
MARIRKRGKSWHVEVRKIGAAPEYAAFPTKAEAQEWAAEIERKIRQGKHTIAHKRTLGDLLEEYAKKVTPKKRGHEWEQRRIAWFISQEVSRQPLSQLTSSVLAAWRDQRLLLVSGETVRRDMNLLSHALNVAIKEWGWLAENPLKRVSRPAGNPPRERIATDAEIEAVCIAGGYRVGSPTGTLTARTAAAFVFSTETGMRSGEILGLTPSAVSGAVATLPKTKNGDRREVPLSPTALQILDDVGGSFGLTGPQRDALWRKICRRAGVTDLHFHDGRATAITRLSKRLDPLALAKIVGHRNIAELMTYYRESAADIAKRLV